MDLTQTSVAAVVAKIRLQGAQVYTVPAGDRLKLKTSGVDRLSVDCPAGKSWEVTVTVDIIETDA